MGKRARKDNKDKDIVIGYWFIGYWLLVIGSTEWPQSTVHSPQPSSLRPLVSKSLRLFVLLFHPPSDTSLIFGLRSSFSRLIFRPDHLHPMLCFYPCKMFDLMTAAESVGYQRSPFI